MTDERWIVIPGWDRFQHRDAGRSGRGLVWLRDYADQLGKDEYRDLTFHQRGLLRDIRHAYATTQGQLRDDTARLCSRFGQRVFRHDLERLAAAGFIQFSASRPPALNQQLASLEVEVEVGPYIPNGNPAGQARGAVSPTRSVREGRTGFTCPHCGVECKGPNALADHLADVHWDDSYLATKGGGAQ